MEGCHNIIFFSSSPLQGATIANNPADRFAGARKPILGGALPEYLPPAEHIKQVEERIKQTSPKLALDGPEAERLSNDDSETQ